MLLREPRKQGSLVPTLGLFTAITLIVGSMIGSGIFRLPANMMALVQNPLMLILVWVVGGIFTIAGALVFAELAGMFPAAGGQYAFIRESIGKKWAFLYGWSFFWIVQTGIIAGVALVFAEFTRRLLGYPNLPGADATVAVSCIVLLSLVNYLGARFGGLVQDIFTVAKVGALGLLIILGFILGTPEHSTFDQPVAGAPAGMALFSAFFGAMLLALFALDGWPQAAYVAPEIKDARRNVPRAMILGVSSVTVVYVLATAAYLYLVSAPEIIEIGRGGAGGPIAAAAAEAFAGETGARLISAAVMISTFGTVNAFILTSPRIFYACAEDGLFPRMFRRLDPKTNTPSTAIIVQGIWAGLLVCLARLATDAYTAIVSGVVFTIWLFYLPTVYGYFKLRRERPDIPRPYRTTFYPVTPIVFSIAGLLVVGNTYYQDIYDYINGGSIADQPATWGTLVILLGAIVLAVWLRLAKQGKASPFPSDD